MTKRFIRVLPTDPKCPGERYRLERVEDEHNVWLCEEVVWPEKVCDVDAHHIRETHDSLCLTPEHQRWLYGALGELLGVDSLAGKIALAWQEYRAFVNGPGHIDLGISPGAYMSREQALQFRLHELLDRLAKAVP